MRARPMTSATLYKATKMLRVNNDLHKAAVVKTRLLQCRKVKSRLHAAVIRVCDPAGNVIETHEHRGYFRVVVQLLSTIQSNT